jgi:hypothetical protein
MKMLISVSCRSKELHYTFDVIKYQTHMATRSIRNVTKKLVCGLSDPPHIARCQQLTFIAECNG